MTCRVCLSVLKAGDLFCSSCGAATPDHPAAPARPAGIEARGRIAGERKYLTVLCADLQRSTDLISDLDPEEAISRLEPALVAMRTAVRRNRGIVSKEGGDGLIALFGAPHADDNHAVMACYAAVELVRRIKLLNDPELHVRVGLHSGYVVTHTIEADLSSIYEAGGPAVHLVKRFEGAAQAGQILVSESCQNLSAGLVTFKSLAPRRMEGFPAPVPCHELVEISGLSRWRARSTKGLSSFVGRTEETSLLEQAARTARSSGEKDWADEKGSTHGHGSWEKHSGAIPEAIRHKITEVIATNLRSAHPMPLVLKVGENIENAHDLRVKTFAHKGHMHLGIHVLCPNTSLK